MRIRDTLSAEFSRLCYYGFWYAPEMELVMNSIDFSQKNVTGVRDIIFGCIKLLLIMN